VSRPLATDQLHVRIPPAEKRELLAEARRHGISMSALVRISVMAARGGRERVALMREAYPSEDAYLPADMFMTGGGFAFEVPLDFHIDHGHRREVTEAEVRILQEAMSRVEQAEGFDLGMDEPDPRAKLRKLSQLLGRLKHEESVKTIKDLLKQWGMTSPPVIEVATGLNEVLELWAKLLVAEVGLIDPEAAKPSDT